MNGNNLYTAKYSLRVSKDRFSGHLGITWVTLSGYRDGVSERITKYIQVFLDCDFHVVQIAIDPFLQTELSHAICDVPGQVEVFERIGLPAYHKGWKTEVRTGVRKYEKRIHPAFASADIIHVANTDLLPKDYLTIWTITQLFKR